MDVAMLVCAAVGSMAFGLLAAFAVLRAGFWLMRPQQRTVQVKARADRLIANS